MRNTKKNRRDFVRTLALGLGASAATVAPPTTNPSRADEPKPKEEAARTEADARMELVLARFGKRLDAEARAAVRSEVEAIVRRAEQLRKVPLDNGDGPFPVFTPYRAPLGREESSDE